VVRAFARDERQSLNSRTCAHEFSRLCKRLAQRPFRELTLCITIGSASLIARSNREGGVSNTAPSGD
jgi:hypothetical protein